MELVAMAVVLVVTAAIILAPVLRRPEALTPSASAVNKAGIAAEVDARLEAEIAAARSGARCVACGSTLPRDARYCPACGAPVGLKLNP